MSKIFLRDVDEADLAVFFEQHSDPEANYMAAFTAKDPSDRIAFTIHWNRIRNDETVIIKTIVLDGEVVGYVLSYVESARPEVAYWISKAYWGQGIATRALGEFLAKVNPGRPIYAHVAKDNLGSIRVLEKCGFRQTCETRGFANARRKEIEELVFELVADKREGFR